MEGILHSGHRPLLYTDRRHSSDGYNQFFIDWFLMVFTLPVPVFFVICFIIALFIPEIAFIADKISRFLKRVTRRQG
ncbi:hypothetical protein EN46_26170 [Citrobacter amalonaticus]